MEHSNPGQWSVAQVWNNTNREDRETKPRDYLYASELGRAPIDVFLRLKGISETNPANDRAKRKFDGGELAEWVVGSTLKRAGILKQTQTYSVLEATPTTLKVTGRLDFVAGGTPDLEMANAWLELLTASGLPEKYAARGERILQYLQEKYPNGLVEKPLEVKSLSGMMFDAFLAKGTASKNHRLQLYHYMKTNGYEWGDVVYISRDDTRLAQIAININSQTKIDYENAILALSTPVLTGVQPPKEKEIVWDNDMGKFASNWNVRYSGYLTMLYGFESTEKFDEVYKGKVASWNRVLGRVKDGAKMTEKNLLAISEMEAAGFDANKLAQEYLPTADEAEQV